MKYNMLFTLFSFSCLTVTAQMGIRVEYGEIFSVVSFKNKMDIKEKEYNRKHYVYANGDSIGFCSFHKQKPNKKNNTVGNDKDHHAAFIFPKLNRILAENHWVKPYNLSEHELNGYNWQINTDTMWIAGYKCKAASADGVVAWFTDDIPNSFGPSFYGGLPGLILMVEDYRNRRLYKAISVKPESPKIVIPDLPFKACENCESKLSEIKRYFER